MSAERQAASPARLSRTRERGREIAGGHERDRAGTEQIGGIDSAATELAAHRRRLLGSASAEPFGLAENDPADAILLRVEPGSGCSPISSPSTIGPLADPLLSDHQPSADLPAPPALDFEDPLYK